LSGYKCACCEVNVSKLARVVSGDVKDYELRNASKENTRLSHTFLIVSEIK